MTCGPGACSLDDVPRIYLPSRVAAMPSRDPRGSTLEACTDVVDRPALSSTWTAAMRPGLPRLCKAQLVEQGHGAIHLVGGAVFLETPQIHFGQLDRGHLAGLDELGEA